MIVEPVVVVVRLNTGDELLAILAGELEGKVKLEHPHYVKFNPTTGTVAMVPYCPLSEEKFYELWRVHCQFVVTAGREISQKFFAMVDTVEAKQHRELLEFEEPLDQLEAAISENTYIPGNDTKH